MGRARFSEAEPRFCPARASLSSLELVCGVGSVPQNPSAFPAQVRWEPHPVPLPAFPARRRGTGRVAWATQPLNCGVVSPVELPRLLCTSTAPHWASLGRGSCGGPPSLVSDPVCRNLLPWQLLQPKDFGILISGCVCSAERSSREDSG